VGDDVRVNDRGAARWARGHPWIFASDVQDPDGEPGVRAVTGSGGRFLGWALYSPRSEIRLRLLDRRSDVRIDRAWWRERIARAAARRGAVDATAFRLVHAEADGLPSLVVDRYDRWIVAQLLSAGLETVRDDVVAAIAAVTGAAGILLRNDPPVRTREGLAREVVEIAGRVPDRVVVREGPVRYEVAPHTGQKTGAFLDQRANRIRAGQLMPAGGRALDCFSFHGSFALHLAHRAASVLAMDVSADALAQGARNAALNGLTNIQWREADVFDALRELERAGLTFDLVVVDPPAFAKSRATVPRALKGYKDVNLRAMRLVEPGGHLLTASCSYHVGWPDFLAMLREAAGDSGRRITMVEHLAQGADHPEVLTVPETGYLKGAILRVD
jgi:23S rRNA (cytosine1962-C5)-methyltransferase